MNIQRDIFPQRGAESLTKPSFAFPTINQTGSRIESQTFTGGTDFTIGAGAAGATLTIQLPIAPIAAKGRTAIFGDSAITLAGALATTLATEVAFIADSANDQGSVTTLANGEYMVDYERGRIYGKRADANATGTAAYSFWQPEVSLNSDIEIGAVELKDGTSEERAIINDANTARAATDNVLLVQALNATGGVLGTAPMPISFTTTVVQAKATGAAAINLTTAVAAEFRLVQVTCHFSTAPTTSENFIIKLDAQAGAAYDTALFTTNPSLSAATDVVFIPDNNLDFFAGDEIVVTFTNTDARTYGVTIYYETI